MAACNAGVCGWSCTRFFADCNRLADDGCEQDTSSDPSNCGACGAVCHGECIRGFCTVHVSDGELNPSGLVIAGASLYWTVRDSSTVSLRPSDGALVQLAGGQDEPAALAVSTTSAYWTNRGSGEVKSVARGGGPASIRATGQARPREIILVEQRLYWVNEGTNGTDGSVMRLDLGGGAPQVVSSTAALPGGQIVATAGAPKGLAAVTTLPGGNQPWVYGAICWGDPTNRVVWGVSPAGGPPFPFAFAQAPWNPTMLIGGAERLYVLNGATDSLQTHHLYIPGMGADFEPPFQLGGEQIPGLVAAASPWGAMAWIAGGSVRWR